jgi:photosystem II stability/assembly factor-like uncharacterized protein
VAILIRKYLLCRWLFCLGISLYFALNPLHAEGRRIVGPGGGGAMFHVTINPLDANEVLLSCDMTGAYISHDGGHHWRMFNLRNTIKAFAFDPIRQGTLYALTDVLWRSTNDGLTWKLMWPHPSMVRGIRMDSDHADETVLANTGSIGQITSFVIDPADSRTLYAASTQKSRIVLIVSHDAGDTWHRLRILPETPLHLWVDPRSPKDQRDVYVVASHGVQARIDGVWNQRDAPEGAEFADITAGFPDENGSAPTFYAITQDVSPGVFLSIDGGQSWSQSQLPGASLRPRAIATSLHHPGVAYVSYKSMPRVNELLQGVARTDDFGKHWNVVWSATADKESNNVQDAWIATKMTPQWTEEPLSLSVDEHDPNLAYATDLGRTLATTDGGKSWTARYSESANHEGHDVSWVSTGLDVTTTYGYLIDPFDPKRRFILTTDIGLFRSEDSGRSWMRSVSGVPEQWTNTTYSIVFDPEVRGKMWAAMSDVHDLPRPKMWRHTPTSHYVGGICVSTDGGRTWRASSAGMPPTAPTHLLLDPKSPVGHRTLWAATMGHGIYRSIDDGHTWSAANNGIVQQDALAWRLALASDGTLYALIARRSEDGSIGNSGDGALYRSIDGGENWAAIALPFGANAPNGLAIDPKNPKRLYLALWARATPRISSQPASGMKRPQVFNGRYGGIALSIDGGKTWRWVLDRDKHIYDVTIDSLNPRILYASGFESSAWISRDQGQHWNRIPGFNFKWGHRIQADPEDPGMVYISTFGGGVWHISISGPPIRDIATPGLMP